MLSLSGKRDAIVCIIIFNIESLFWRNYKIIKMGDNVVKYNKIHFMIFTFIC